jgi:hypothetical protein
MFSPEGQTTPVKTTLRPSSTSGSWRSRGLLSVAGEVTGHGPGKHEGGDKKEQYTASQAEFLHAAKVFPLPKIFELDSPSAARYQVN